MLILSLVQFKYLDSNLFRLPCQCQLEVQITSLGIKPVTGVRLSWLKVRFGCYGHSKCIYRGSLIFPIPDSCLKKGWIAILNHSFLFAEYIGTLNMDLR